MAGTRLKSRSLSSWGSELEASPRAQCANARPASGRHPKPPKPTASRHAKSASCGKIGEGEPNPAIFPVFKGSRAKKDRFSGRCMCPRPEPNPNPMGLILISSIRYGKIAGGEPNSVISFVVSSLMAKKGRFFTRCMSRCMHRPPSRLAEWPILARRLPIVGDPEGALARRLETPVDDQGSGWRSRGPKTGASLPSQERMRRLQRCGRMEAGIAFGISQLPRNNPARFQVSAVDDISGVLLFRPGTHAFAGSVSVDRPANRTCRGVML